MWLKHFDIINQSTENDAYLLLNSFIINITAINAQNYEKFFNKIKKKLVTMKKLKKKISKKFHKYLNNWNFKKINKISFHKKWNHCINLNFEFTSSIKKIYEFSRNQIIVVKYYINDMLNKNFIRFNYFDYLFSILIVKKSENEFKICVDYKILNVFDKESKHVVVYSRDFNQILCYKNIHQIWHHCDI